jgi:hypothetical protein
MKDEKQTSAHEEWPVATQRGRVASPHSVCKSLNSDRAEFAQFIPGAKDVFLCRVVSPRLHLVLVVKHVNGDSTSWRRARYRGNSLSVPNDVTPAVLLDQLGLSISVGLKMPPEIWLEFSVARSPVT